ncbi:MAG TPA: hypothetical protein VKH35_17320 [Thermoanaerobaculia bacterium]|nr:hypothetical protein [Thermoanaerobaculia bacterium]
MRTVLVLSALLVTLPAVAQIPEGDQQFALRAEGHQSGHAQPARIDAAIAAYQRAVAQNPSDLEARWKLLRAIRFKGAYVARTNDEKKPIYDQGKKAGEEALALVYRQVNQKQSEKQIAEAAAKIPGAAEVFFWDSVNWGEWALAYGKMAALRQGAADRIRREATIAMLIDPKLEGGGPPRVLGRLHDQTPHVPFITGWASEKEALRFLNESLQIDPTNKITQVFLAEAMVSNDSATKPQAVEILRKVLSTPNDPNYEVEQAAAQDDARALLVKWRA